ncbi:MULTISPECIES: hypothetical protein [Sulfurospirillum]|uniref:Uncharacterized protein n=4 Tax=Sulfurospirillum TaxID=57665 RepID=A0A1Y0HLI1_9BACT|nr:MULTISPECIES: hypothetical protein [Sulfurospirillum]AHJ12843.1 hypothetical protein SMUL_1583 [Sulfurospirillum multivorans DSM 12446]AOO65319.1 hypothetical protein SHALO_1544 [Sulfurospirillum halorespirans DSM 13726]ARU48800.1 hypothetical protein Sdiek1_1637 [Sulfurospirillum diekertiae]ASC93621.1 hypothetical protein Sdiek2_1603 [Sulfurospirillum diekertiae]ATB69664.1 hypothetical protein SJPD1_1555 [Sulfurospirillum diekertiae]
MHYFKKELQEVDVLNQIRCDVCGEHYESNSLHKELIHSEHTFGYDGALLEDISRLNMDICEKCLYDWVKSHGLYHSVITPSYDLGDKKQENLNDTLLKK